MCPAGCRRLRHTQKGQWLMQYITQAEYEKYLILADIQRTKQALDNAYSNFQNVVDPDLIDCYIYEVKSVQQKYKYLLKRAKELQL